LRGEVSGDVGGSEGRCRTFGWCKALDDPVHGFALFGSEALGVVEVFLPVVLDVALDAVQEVYSEVPDRGQVACFQIPEIMVSRRFR
jgi:hypothetical protein